MTRTIIRRTSDGRWAAGEKIFQDEASAKLYADSRDPTFRRESGTKTEWLSWAIVVVFVGSVINACMPSSMAPSTSTPTYSSAAFTLCQTALKQVSRDPETADVPYVSDQGSGDTSYFAWGATSQMTRMRNSLGLEVAAPASCTVSKSQKRITSLTLDGKSIL